VTDPSPPPQPGYTGPWSSPAPFMPTPRPCVVCGSAVVPRERPIVVKQRVKFGAFWVTISILTCWLAVLVWLIWPRNPVVVNVDRWLECTACGARQT
jgi:hypothetical protein